MQMLETKYYKHLANVLNHYFKEYYLRKKITYNKNNKLIIIRRHKNMPTQVNLMI